MESSMLNMKVWSRNGLLYPMLVIAAISVIVFSVLGVATMTGLLPRAESMNNARATNDGHTMTQPGKHVSGNVDPACANCGVVESIVPVEVKAGGAFTGNEIEKNRQKAVRYQVWVRMRDGTSRTSYLSSAPAFETGDKVKVGNGQVVALD
jgi:outer membrane lipoprotein SlyB